MWNRSFETQTKLNKNWKEKQKKFSYDTNNLNQYLDRSIYVDIEEAVEEIGTGDIIPDTTATGSIEVVDTEVITEEEFLEEETQEEVTLEEDEIELEWRLLYDANGNMIWNMLNNKRQYIYSYDYKNRLVKIEKNIYKKVNNSETDEIEHKKKIVQIKYDVLWRRIQKLFNSGGYRNYIYSNQHVILEENYSKKDKLKNSKQFTYSNSLDDVLSMKLIENKTRKIEEEYVSKKGKTKTRKIKESYVETNTYFYQKDHLGSIIAITDETGTIVEEYVYDIFGKPYSKQIDWKITILKKSPVGNTRMYTGREYDRGLKLYYNRARYYDPKLARFISRDPIDIADDVNLYAYVGNNSVMFVDLMGTEKLSIPLYDYAYALRAYLIYKEVKGKITDVVVEINESINYDLLIDAGKPLKLVWAWWVTIWLSTCVNWSLVTAWAGTVPSCGWWLTVAWWGAIMAATWYWLEWLGKIGKNSQKWKTNWSYKDPTDNKINHIFWKKQHNLDGLVEKYWSKNNAYNKLLENTKNQINQTNWLFEKVINVWWKNVTVKWNVIDWNIHIWTAYIP